MNASPSYMETETTLEREAEQRISQFNKCYEYWLNETEDNSDWACDLKQREYIELLAALIYGKEGLTPLEICELERKAWAAKQARNDLED